MSEDHELGHDFCTPNFNVFELRFLVGGLKVEIETLNLWFRGCNFRAKICGPDLMVQVVVQTRLRLWSRLGRYYPASWQGECCPIFWSTTFCTKNARFGAQSGA